MKIHVVNSKNFSSNLDLLNDFLKARRNIYIEEKGWMPDDGREIETDQFDNRHATYLIGEIDGEVMTGTRLYPTMKPHMLSEVFPEFGVLRSPTVYEWTRGFIIPKYREAGHGPIKGQFCGTVMEYCLIEGITQIGGLQDLYWLRLWRRYGWKVHEIGPRMKVDNRMCVAAYFDVTEEARVGALHEGGMTANESILVYNP
jgi:acyl-homoserine lactone synthase